MYKLRQSIRYIYSQAEKAIELDDKDHTLTLQHWELHSSNTFMKLVIFGPKKEMNSYPTLQHEQHTVEQFLNKTVEEAMCCLDTQEPSNDPSTTPDKVLAANISNPHYHTVDQLPHTYQASNHEYSNPPQ